MTQKVPPCLNCPLRQPGCHDKCEKYQEYRAYKDALNKKMQLEKLEKDAKAVSNSAIAKKHRKNGNKRHYNFRGFH